MRGDAHEVIVDVDSVVLALTLVVVKTCAEADVAARKETTNCKSDSCIVWRIDLRLGVVNKVDRWIKEWVEMG